MDIEQLLPDDQRVKSFKMGIRHLQKWLEDIFIQGMATIQFNAQFLNRIASRMVDAKMGKVARQIRELGAQDKNNPENITDTLLHLNLICHCMQHFDQLNTKQKLSLCLALGYSLRKEKLQKLAPLTDKWLVLSNQTSNEENLTVRKVWLYGYSSKRCGLILDFSFLNQGFKKDYQLGKCYSGGCIYYPEAVPLRLIDSGLVVSKEPEFYPITSFKDVDTFADLFAALINKQPWLRSAPVLVRNVKISMQERAYLIDQNHKAIPISNPPAHSKALIAFSRGSTFLVAGIYRPPKIEVLMAQQDHERFFLSAV